MIRPILHLILHFVVPIFPAFHFYRKRWKIAWLVMAATMLVDLDHFMVVPIYAPNRCSIGFHPLHSYWAISFYGVMAGFKKTRLIALGLFIHMFLDGIDCLWMSFE